MASTIGLDLGGVITAINRLERTLRALENDYVTVSSAQKVKGLEYLESDMDSDEHEHEHEGDEEDNEEE